MKEKTAIEWFSEVKNLGVRNELIANTVDRDEKRLYHKHHSLSTAIIYSFLWEITKQGGKFWSKIYNKNI